MDPLNFLVSVIFYGGSVCGGGGGLRWWWGYDGESGVYGSGLELQIMMKCSFFVDYLGNY